MSFVTLHYLPSRGATPATMVQDAMARRRPIRVTADALPELLDILIRFVDFQLPPAQRYVDPEVCVAAQSSLSPPAAARPAGSVGFFSRMTLSSGFFGFRAPVSASPPSAPSTEAAAAPHGTATHAAAATLESVAPVVRFYPHFPGLRIATRPDNNDDTSHASACSSRAQRVLALIQRAQQLAEAIVRHRRRSSASPTLGSTSSPPSPPSLEEPPSSHTSPTSADSGTWPPLPSVPTLRLSASPPLARARSQRSDTELSSHHQGSSITSAGAMRTRPQANWMVRVCDPWLTAPRRAGPDEVGMELRIRAYRAVSISGAGDTSHHTPAHSHRRNLFAVASAAASGVATWLSPVIGEEPLRTAPLMEWVVPIIQVAHRGVTFLELDLYSHTLEPVSALPVLSRVEAGRRTPTAEAVTKKLFCDHADDVRQVLDFILDSFSDALAMDVLSLTGAAAAGGPGALAEIRLDVQVIHKKSF